MGNGDNVYQSVSVADVVNGVRTNKKKLVATLVHIKKEKPVQVVSYKDKKGLTSKSSNYFRFLLLTDDHHKSFGVMIKSGPNANYVFMHHEQFWLGDKVVVSKPKFEGKLNNLPLIIILLETSLLQSSK